MNMHIAAVNRWQGWLQDCERCDQVNWIHAAGWDVLENCRLRHPPGELNTN